ncbi:MAG: hypothetical protein C4523_06235 [Myxococcales bacterium]|nr:MAG: hypothetical protein C4523_06235 [Myxococcales bacterium]
MKHFGLAWLPILLTVLTTWGCGEPSSPSPGDEGDGDRPLCSVPEDCHEGATCVDGRCVPDSEDEGDGDLEGSPTDDDPSEWSDKELSDDAQPEEEESETEDATDADMGLESEAELDGDDSEPEPEAEEADVEAEPFYSPDDWGPYTPGEMDFAWRDMTRGGILGKDVASKVWYPALAPPPGAARVRYMALIEGLAYPNVAPDRSGALYPLVLFSHGNKGVNFQSFTFTSRLASHGFIIVAPNHAGNTMFDNPNDEQMAQIALDRPVDIKFVRQQIADLNNDPASPLFQMIDLSRAGVAGHSFGGFTTLILAGGTVNVDDARARCLAGTEADIFCPYIDYWPAGQTVSRPASFAHFQAAVAMAPGGYAAFGDDGLANVTMPVLVMGGTLDEFLRPELRPTYAAVPPPKAKVEITGMGHMGFTDICRIPGVELIPTLGDMCNPDNYINVDRGWEIINPFAIAFLRRYLKDERSMDAYLTAEFAARFPEVAFEAQLASGRARD